MRSLTSLTFRLSRLPLIESKRIVYAIVALSVFSQLSVPCFPVPLTLQTLCVMGIGLLLPPGQAFLSVLTWMTLGTMGLPLFSCFSSGPLVILGPRGGYILGFLIAAPLLSFLYRKIENAQKGKDMSLIPLTLCLVVTSSLVLFMGWIFLSFLMQDANSAWLCGVLPFLFPESVKIGLTLSSASLWKRWRVF